jgi:6-phosphofructokinase 1
MKRIGILNSGGDCPGLNAVIASAAKVGIRHGYEFIGFIKGWEGLLTPMNYRTLDAAAVRGISHLGGTILGTVNRGRFGAKKGAGDTRQIPLEILDEAKANLQAVGCDGLIVIGGDGTLSGAAQLAERGVKIIGVPKTIDNDLDSTDRTFGYSTAVQVVVDALDRIHTTATSHDRVMLVETMGRHAGWIAIRAGLAGGADAILVPEFPFEVERLVEFLRDRQKNFGSSIVVVAEGIQIRSRLTGESQGSGQEIHLGGAVNSLSAEMERLAPGEFEIRGAILGHIQRGGTPSAADRMLAKAYGVAAFEAFERGEFGTMVTYSGLHMRTVPLTRAVGQIKHVSQDTVEYQTANQLGVFMH